MKKKLKKNMKNKNITLEEQVEGLFNLIKKSYVDTNLIIDGKRIKIMKCFFAKEKK